MLVVHIDDEPLVLKSCERLVDELREGLRIRSTSDTRDDTELDESHDAASTPHDNGSIMDFWVGQAAERQIDPQNLQFKTFNSAKKFWSHLNRKRKAKRVEPSLVILDLKLNGIDEKSGLKQLRKIRENSKISDVPVVMLSTHTDASFVNESYARGANGYVGKGGFEDFNGRFLELITYWVGLSKLPQRNVRD